MKQTILDLPTQLKLVSIIILMAGLGSAMLIYVASGNNDNGGLGYREEGGSVYPIMPNESKKYLRDMELYGGKANVIADEFRRWFVGLWRGESLAYTITCITLIISSGTFYFAAHLPSSSESDEPSENDKDINI